MPVFTMQFIAICSFVADMFIYLCIYLIVRVLYFIIPP